MKYHPDNNRRIILSLCAIFLFSCSSNEGSGPDIRVGFRVEPVSGSDAADDENGKPTTGLDGEEGSQISRHSIPALNTEQENRVLLDGIDGKPVLSDRVLDVSIPPQSVPEFINTVFGELLGVGFVLGEGIAQRNEIVSFRTARSISEADLYEAASNVLEDFGIAILFEAGQVKALEQDSLKRKAPLFIRSRSRRSVPSGLRPVFMFVDLLAIKANEMTEILKSAFPDRKQLSVKANTSSNSLTLSGLPGDVELALQIINQMDELSFAGTETVTYNVRNWETRQLAKTAEDILALEGFSITSESGAERAITLLPIEYTRQIMVLARRKDMLEYALDTVTRLDRAASQGKTRHARVYRAQYYDARELVSVLREVYQSIGDSKDGGATVYSGGSFSGSFVVDPQGNRIIFFGTDEEYREVTRLISQIDRPSQEVLIEATIAEVTLNDELTFGLESALSQIVDGDQTNGRISNTGLNALYLIDGFSFDLTAVAKNQQINVLSTPRIVVKSGARATIQVGTDVPIITSQSAASSQTSGSSNVLQSVKYRKTGIILDIEPLVFSDNRIDLKVEQELSSTDDEATSVVSSPVISNRNIKTQLSLQDGQSAILGGLIENRYTRGDSGIPFLKDLPLLGRLFASTSLNSQRTVLMVMLTPYILSTRGDRDNVVRAFSDVVNEAFENQVDKPKTLIKPHKPFQVEE